MKKALLFIAVLIFLLSACAKEPTAVRTVDGGLKTYYEMSDGSWKCGDHFYKYRLEISGRMSNASADSTFVYLSNLEEISFDRAWKAAGFSSFSGDYFSLKEAVLVDWRADKDDDAPLPDSDMI